MTIASCLKSMRLRTLPLSLAGILMGIFIAGGANAAVIVFLTLTTCSLQILSNLSNELGDILNGTDTDERQGIHYSIQDGEMTVTQMKKLIASVAIACCIFGLAMIYFSFGSLFALEPLLFIFLGAAAIVAAMKYTLGKNPYGYRAKGDIFVFIFFGLASTLGAFYICSHDIFLAKVLLPACAIGCFSIGVLNVNNIRDMKTDARTRVTVALKLGARKARIYQTVLICAGWLCMIAHTLLEGSGCLYGSQPGFCCFPYGGGCLRWLYLITLPLFALHLKGIWTREDRALDPMLPLLVLSTFAFSVLAGMGMLLSGVLE